jgi:hypothetical protein
MTRNTLHAVKEDTFLNFWVFIKQQIMFLSILLLFSCVFNGYFVEDYLLLIYYLNTVAVGLISNI